MTNSLNLKQRLFLVAFTILIGSQMYSFQDKMQFNFFVLINIDLMNFLSHSKQGGLVIMNFITQLAISFILGVIVIPSFIENIRFSIWDRVMLILFILIPATIFIHPFQDENTIEVGPGYIYNVLTSLYFTPLFIITSFYTLPKFITLSEYQPLRAFKGGLITCAIILPFAFAYDLIINEYPLFLYNASEYEKIAPLEYFIKFLIRLYSLPSMYYSASHGLIWHCISFIASGVSAWFAYFLIYQRNLKNSRVDATIF